MATAKKTAPRPQDLIKYENKVTGETWSGVGKKPTWLKAAIALGRTLEEFKVK